MDPGRDWRGNGGNLFVTRRANQKTNPSKKYRSMDKTLFNLLNTYAPAATLVVRLLAGLVFFAEGIKKFIFPCIKDSGQRKPRLGPIIPCS